MRMIRRKWEDEDDDDEEVEEGRGEVKRVGV